MTHREWVEGNRENAAKGGAVKAARKQQQYQVLNQLANDRGDGFTKARDAARIRMAKTMAHQYDKEREAAEEGPLFSNSKGKLPSRAWFDQWLSAYFYKY